MARELLSVLGIAAVVVVLCGTRAAGAAPRAPSLVHVRSGEYLGMARDLPRDWSSPYEIAGGVPLVDYGSFKAFNPVTVAQYGLAQWSLWTRYGDVSRRVRARVCADWLLEHQRASGAWTYAYPWTAPGSRVPLARGWSSALAQGQAMSLLGRVYRDTRRPRHRTAIRRALRPLRRPVRRGGLARWHRGGLYFEEYPTPEAANFVLNGAIQTLIGLHDVADLAGPVAGDLFRRGTRTAARSVGEFDLPGRRSSVYGLAFRQAPPPGYNAQIRRMLRVLGRLSHRRVFARWARRWSAS